MNHILSGKVIPGDGLGRRLGFPTANIDCIPPETLEDGVYAAYITWGAAKFEGIVIIGDKHRDGKTHRKVELYLLDFDSDVYGETLSAEVVENIRPFETFASTESLIHRIQGDSRTAREIFQKLKNVSTVHHDS